MNNNQRTQYPICENCNNFLSCGPVSVLPNGRSLCGRCQPQTFCIRSEIYEEIARLFRYPCMYWRDHCPRIFLHWDDIVEHEKRCKYSSKCSTFFTSPSAVCKSRKTKFKSEAMQVVDIPQNTLNKLTCSNCQYYLNCPPVYIGPNSRYICHRCYTAKDLNGFLRHVALEQLMQFLVFPCIYKNWGCPNRSRFGELCYSHELECPYGQSYKKVPFTKISVTKDGKIKERGLVESHRGAVWATLTPTSIPFGQGKIKLTSQQSYTNNHVEYNNNNNNNNRKPISLDVSELKQSKGHVDETMYSHTEDGYINRDRKRSQYSDKSGSSSYQSPKHHREFSDISLANGALSTHSSNMDEDPSSLITDGDNYYDNLRPNFSANLNRTGSFLESSIKPSRPLTHKESFAGENYDGILKELKIRQKLKGKPEVERY